MHGRFYNEAILDLTLRPQTPLLIKSGEGAKADIDPTLPDMFFVRTRRPGEVEETIYIPGSSVRGVLRSHAERLVRSIAAHQACDPTRHSREREGREAIEQEEGSTIRVSCLAGERDLDKKPLLELWQRSCYTCRLFGNTGLAARVKVGDWYPNGGLLTEVRYGVAIDRVTGAVAHGPFQLETVTDGTFEGRITLRNFTLGQVGLVGAALLDIADGLVALGHAKSRGLGRVALTFQQLTFRFPRNPERQICGVGVFVEEAVRQKYQFPADDRYLVNVEADRRGWAYELEAEGEAARRWLEELAPRWVAEVQAGGGGS